MGNCPAALLMKGQYYLEPENTVKSTTKKLHFLS